MEKVHLGFITCVLALSAAGSANAELLFNNGPTVTNPTGGTSSIIGLPISMADAGTLPSRTTRGGLGERVADDFDVPAGGWDLDTITLYGFQSSPAPTGTPPVPPPVTIDRVYLRLWNSTPYSVNSPAPLPDPLPQPISETLYLPVLESHFVAYRTQAGSTASNSRPVYALTVSANDLPNQGKLDGGTYWLEWGFGKAGDTTNIAFQVPLISPRGQAHNINARQYNYIGFGPIEYSWFEPRDGFNPPVSDGLAMAFPFALSGTVPEPTSIVSLAGFGMLSLIRRRRTSSVSHQSLLR